jgi:uncharacterized circularly permuted ATP-grasp superfamily protein/uncharacterized alpha-E superfamily protein
MPSPIGRSATIGRTVTPPSPGSPSLFDHLADASPQGLAAVLAPPAAAGHFDELRGRRADGAAGAALAPAWDRFFATLGDPGFGDLGHRTANLQRQVQDNGITYNVYADAGGPHRPWSLDLFPLIIEAADWQHIESGVLQRVELLERILADAYGPRELLAANLLPPALVLGHPGYLRPMQGVRPGRGRRLPVAAFDLARDEQGRWWVVSQRTQAPSGLGYLLENRLIISRLFPQAFADLRVQRLAATYSALLEGLRADCPDGGEAPRIVLLTPGPYNETYFEHAFLARYLGLTLVEGSDLTVRDERLYLRTLGGLEPVHGVLKRVDDEFLDPLELRPDSRLGVPGMLQAIRAGNVLVANSPGSAFLESPGLLGFLPALARELLGQELKLPSLATWWCGEEAAMQSVLPQLAQGVVKPTYGGAAAGAVPARSLEPTELARWSDRIRRHPDLHTVQSWLPLSQMPTWNQERIAMRSLMVRVFAVADGPRGWRVLPGGLTRLAGPAQDIASMQSGGSSADTWVLARGEVDRTTLLAPDSTPAAVVARRQRVVTSRAAENLFWFGRYTERIENTTRLARLSLECISGETEQPRTLLDWLHDMAAAHGLVAVQAAAPGRAGPAFQRALLARLADPGATSVGFNLAAMHAAASAVRERLSLEQWNEIVRTGQAFEHGCAGLHSQGEDSAVDALGVLERLSAHMAAITGVQTDRMTRDNGWRLLSIGRHLERLGFLSAALSRGLESGTLLEQAGFDAMLALFDSSLTFRRLHQKRRDHVALVDLLVLDPDNPRSLAWVLQTLRGRLARLAQLPQGSSDPLLAGLPDPDGWSLEALCDGDGGGLALQSLLLSCTGAAWQLSDELASRYFTLTDESRESVGA